MRIYAIDCRVGEPDISPFGLSYCTDESSGHFTDWDEWRDHAASHGERGYTMVAYGAELAVTLSLYNRGQMVKCFYRNQQFTHAEWYYDCNHDAMPIWDCAPLCGRLPLVELQEAVDIEPYETPQRYTWQYRKRWARPCVMHQVEKCKLCWGEIERALWSCRLHDRPECDACWKDNHSRAIYAYMERYARMAEGYGLSPSRTMGGMSHAMWRHLESPNPCKLSTREQDDFARRGYRAGRTEAFKLGSCGPVAYGDVSQMYGAILSTIRLPTPSDCSWTEGEAALESLPYIAGIADCTVSVPDTYVPPLGIIHNDHFVFPTGTFRGHFTTPELRLAVSRGTRIVTMHRMLAGPATVQPFTGYATGLMEWREELRRKHDPLEIVVKLLLNSLYGMIGMKAWHESESIMPMPAETTMSDWPYHDIKVLQDHVLMRRTDVRYRRGAYSNPLWAALITAEARVKLYHALESCGPDLAYCDTDSVITTGELQGTAPGPGNLQDRGFYHESYILAPKLYRLRSFGKAERAAHAGISQWQLDRLIEQGRASSHTPIGPLEGFHTGLQAGRWVTLPVERKYDTGKRLAVNPRWMDTPDGWTDTRPLVLGEVYDLSP